MDNNIPSRNRKHILFHKPDGGAIIAFCPPPHPHCRPRKTFFDPFSLALWKKIDGSSGISRLADSLAGDGWSQAEVVSIPDILDTWVKDGLVARADHGRREERVSPKEERARSIARRMLAAYQSAQNSTVEIQSSREYHQNLNIENPDLHFDRVEGTVSHCFSSPHPVLEGKTYGGRLWERLSVQLKQRKGLRVAEVGGGTGALARGFLNQLHEDRPDLWRGLFYVFVDLSRAFISSQQSKCCRHRAKTGFIQASGQCLPLGRSTVDVLICNEVIADFDVVRLCRSELEKSTDSASPAKRQALGQIKRLGLSLEDAPPGFLFPWGAISFLEEAWRILAPGGLALVVEYGDESLYPQEVVFEGHKEYTIHFDLLRRAAQCIGFKTELRGLLSFLAVDENMQVLSPCGSCLLVTLLGNRVREAASKFPTRQVLSETLEAELESLENLPFNSIESEFKDFWALLLRKPSEEGG
jgi:ubiquinone/menaquinone biosynthesis C-methylase UbiE